MVASVAYQLFVFGYRGSTRLKQHCRFVIEVSDAGDQDVDGWLYVWGGAV